MTYERRILLSLDEIKAVVFRCEINGCGARTSLDPLKIEGIPSNCARGHGWKWDFPDVRETAASPVLFFVIGLQKIRRLPKEQTGFTLFLEFEEPLR